MDQETHSPVPSKILWLISLAIFGVIVAVNQIAAHEHAPEQKGIEIPGLEDQVLFQTKLAVKLSGIEPQAAGGVKSMFAGEIAKVADPERSAVERLRLAIALAELDTASAGMSELESIDIDTLVDDLEPLKADVEAVRNLLQSEAVSESEAAGLRERHGFYADLALTHGKPSTDPDRAAVEGGGAMLIGMLIFVGIVALSAFVGFIVGVVLLILMLAKGGLTWRLDRSTEPGTIYLESFCVFLTAFAALHIGSPLIFGMLGGAVDGAKPPPWQLSATLLIQLSLSITIFWPLVRGVSWERWKRDMGWSAERGVLREIGAGIVGYVAMLPFLFAAIIVLLVYMFVSKSMNPDTAPPSNPIAEVIDASTGFQLVLLFVLMTVWAPIVEEHFFRGFLYRHLRSRFAIGVSAILSGLFFGLMHGYGGIMLLPVITIGIGFAVMREWRGCILPTVVAHFIHNFAIGASAIGFFIALK